VGWSVGVVFVGVRLGGECMAEDGAVGRAEVVVEEGGDE